MKKRWKWLLLLGAVFLFAGCGAGEKDESQEKGQEAASNGDTAITIEDGTYIVPEDKTISEGTGFLALNIKIQNKSKDSLNLSSTDVSLYDEEDNKIVNENVYSYDDTTFKNFSSDTISGGKSANGYLVYQVDKDKKYELHYTSSSAGEEKEEITLNVDAKKYKDQSSTVTDLTAAYVDQVFLNKTADKKTANLSNDLAAEHETFTKEFATVLGDSFNHYEPSEAELMTAVEAFETANANKAKVTYIIKNYFPNSATVLVKAETLHLEDLDSKGIIEEFVEKNKGTYNDYDKVYNDAEKYLLENMPSRYDAIEVSTNDRGNSDGYAVQLTKEDDKWTIDTSDSSKNYSFGYLKQAFMGNLYN